MLYLHDIWINWFEGEENGYNVCYFHEWRKEDNIELLDRVPLLYITTPLYNFIENDMHELPKGMLQMIHKESYIRKGRTKTPLIYASVVTDGNEIIAFDTESYKMPIRKSRLMPRQEQLVYDMVKNKKQQSFKFDQSMYEKDHHILSLKPEFIFGLTRRERQLKQLLMMCLDQLRVKNNLEELRYWLTEWNPKKYPYIRFMNEDKVWAALYESVKIGWSLAHEELSEKLIKGHPFLESIWEQEQRRQPNPTK